MNITIKNNYEKQNSGRSYMILFQLFNLFRGTALVFLKLYTDKGK